MTGLDAVRWVLLGIFVACLCVLAGYAVAIAWCFVTRRGDRRKP